MYDKKMYEKIMNVECTKEEIENFSCNFGWKINIYLLDNLIFGIRVNTIALLTILQKMADKLSYQKLEIGKIIKTLNMAPMMVMNTEK